MTNKIIVYSTCGSMDEAERIARHLVDLRLAACAQITTGIKSFYHWQGKLEEDEEFRLTIKSRHDLFESLCTELRKLHSYDVPQIVAVSVVDGAASYLDWVDKELRAP